MDNPKNIVIILTDQHRAGLTAREGFPLDPTPTMDSLARQGVFFTRAYTTSPICAPARTSLLTGRYPTSHRVRQNAAAHLAVHGGHLVKSCREAGFKVGMVGKNHSFLANTDCDYWQEYSHFGQLTGPRSATESEYDQWLAQTGHATVKNPTPYDTTVQLPHRIVSSACSWIDSLGEDRFLLIMSFPEPHNPYQVSEPYFSLFSPETLPAPALSAACLRERGHEWDYLHRLGLKVYPDYDAVVPRARANYLGMLRLIDDEVKRFTDYLAAANKARDTMVICTSDHGDYWGEYGLVRKGAGLGELLVRVPLVISGAGVVPHREARTECVSLADIFPTIAESIGISLPPGVQGKSFWSLVASDPPYELPGFESAYIEGGAGGLPYCSGEIDEAWPGLVSWGGVTGFDELNSLTQSGSWRAVRSGQWKLVVRSDGGRWLHDLSTDPYETVNLYGQAPGTVLTTMLDQLVSWEMRVEEMLPIVEGGYVLKSGVNH